MADEIKGVILAGGLGSRLFPLTKITNKHLLPVYNRPMIHWPILTLVEAGIENIMIVTGGSYAGDFLQLLGNGKELGLRELHYTYQEGEGGIADALSLCADFVDNDRAIVILGDNIFEKSIKHVVDNYREQASGAKILLKQVPDPHRFGVPELQGDKVVGIEEKPKNPKSQYAVTGVYMYDDHVWQVIRGLKPSDRGELEITDVNNAYIGRGDLTWDEVQGWWSDAGTFESLYTANGLVREREQARGGD
jgi:glucose-1-phosphate thymidylyltransferase